MMWWTLFRCFFSTPRQPNEAPQAVHEYWRSFLWTHISCFCMWSRCWKRAWHVGHWNGRRRSCTARTCLLRLKRSVKADGHREHAKLRGRAGLRVRPAAGPRRRAGADTGGRRGVGRRGIGAETAVGPTGGETTARGADTGTANGADAGALRGPSGGCRFTGPAAGAAAETDASMSSGYRRPDRPISPSPGGGGGLGSGSFGGTGATRTAVGLSVGGGGGAHSSASMCGGAVAMGARVPRRALRRTSANSRSCRLPSMSSGASVRNGVVWCTEA